MGVGGQRHSPAALPPGKDPVLIVQEAGLAAGPVWTGQENLAPPPGFDPRTVQPVASRNADWVTRPIHQLLLSLKTFNRKSLFLWCNPILISKSTSTKCKPYYVIFYTPLFLNVLQLLMKHD